MKETKGMNWVKDGPGWTCRLEPEGPSALGPLFTMKVFPKGDNRWTWEIYPRGGERTIAGGTVNSLGAAKTICENFVNRSGLF